MPRTSSTRLGFYEIQSVSGMGEVHRARGMWFGRDVAIMPHVTFARDSDCIRLCKTARAPLVPSCWIGKRLHWTVA